MKDRLWAIGMMSGTSLDGIDVAAIETDGIHVFQTIKGATTPYSAAFKKKLKSVLGLKKKTDETDQIEKELTELHGEAFQAYLKLNDMKPKDIDVIGFHGHTVSHCPPSRFVEPSTWQIGHGALLHKLTGVPVVYDMRQNDLKHGGEGAPLVPLYQKALSEKFHLPIAVINIGGISNVTWIGEDDAILAFDMGPGNTLLDQWVEQHTGQSFDEGGALSQKGAPNEDILKLFSQHAYFKQKPPKSLDRLDFTLDMVPHLSLEDGAATLTEMTAVAIQKGTTFFPEKVLQYIITGGGRHNLTLMAKLTGLLDAPVVSTEAVGWHGDFLEAEAFAFLAVRSLKNLPLTVPTTTGVKTPVTGGMLAK